MPKLCKYSNIFGEPNKGAHAVRVFGMAAVDIAATVGLAGIISYATNINFAVMFIILMIIAVLIHESFCVNTRLNAALFGRPWDAKIESQNTGT